MLRFIPKIVYDHVCGRFFISFGVEVDIVKYDESIPVELTSDGYQLYVIVPIHNGFAAIGRVDKFISPKTIEYVHGEEIKLYEDGKYAYVKDGKLYIETK